MSNRRTPMYYIGTVLIFILIVYFFRTRWASLEIDITDDKATLSYSDEENIEIPLDEVRNIDLLDMFDEWQVVEGINSKDMCFGIFENSEMGKYYAAFNPKIPLIIVFWTEDGNYIVNYEDESATRNLYQAFCDFLDL